MTDWLVVQVGGDTWFVVSRHADYLDAARAVREGQVVVRDGR